MLAYTQEEKKETIPGDARRDVEARALADTPTDRLAQIKAKNVDKNVRDAKFD